METYSPIPGTLIEGHLELAHPDDHAPTKLTLDSPALSVMTDLTLVEAACIGLHDSMDEANRTMIHLGIRLLFVKGAMGQLAGIITATDIKGEKPMRLVQERGLTHGEITVDDLMTPLAQLEALRYDEMSHARVGHVVSSLRLAGRQHTLVIEQDARRRWLVRGMFSTSHIARLLGMPINNVRGTSTFSELVAQLA